jgi:phosphatidyl-myo-inositol alpha-mannosyltransferase
VIRIALFHTTLPERDRKIGGVEAVTHRLGNALTSLGDVDVTVYSLTEAPAGALYRHKRLYKRAPWLGTNYFCRVLLLPMLLNFASFDTAEVVHLHGDDWFFVVRRKPTIRTFHGSALLEANSAHALRKFEWFIIYWFEKISARLSDVSLAIGDSAKRLYGAAYQVDNGVDLELFYPGPKAERPQILYVGTWLGRKRGKWLYQLFVDQILPQHPEAILFFVSDFCPQHPSVIFRKQPSDLELAELYRESWLFAYPSIYEGFGNAYIEALASGTAVVTSPNEGAARILRNGAYGIVTDDDAFASHVDKLLTVPEERKRLEQAGPARAKSFSWPSIARQHRDIYQEAIQ